MQIRYCRTFIYIRTLFYFEIEKNKNEKQRKNK